MARVEHPGEVDEARRPDGAFAYELAHPCESWRIPVIERNSQMVACLVDRRKDRLYLVGVNCHRLLRNYIAPVPQTVDDVAVVESVHGRDDNDVRATLFEHLGKVFHRPRWHLAMTVEGAKASVVIGHPHRAGVAQRHQVTRAGIIAADGVDVHGGPAPGPYDGVA